ncbi:MAG: hypothetical protein H6702_05870 [Myxococcales bacterium]|nr:hypothetical protein [Myxococcales bacterium]
MGPGRLGFAVLLAAAAVGVPALWTALADQDRMRLFYGWTAEGILATAQRQGVQAAAEARLTWARYGTSLAIHTPSRVYVRPDDRTAPAAAGLLDEVARTAASGTAFEAGLIVHRGRDRLGQPLVVAQRDAPLRVHVPGWVLGIAGLGLAGWMLLTLRDRAYWATVWLVLALVAPTVAAWQDLERRRAEQHIPGAWGLLAELNARAGHALGPIRAGDSGWTHSTLLVRPAPEPGAFQWVACRSDTALVLSGRPAMFGFAAWAVLVAVLATALGRAPPPGRSLTP